MLVRFTFWSGILLKRLVIPTSTLCFATPSTASLPTTALPTTSPIASTSSRIHQKEYLWSRNSPLILSQWRRQGYGSSWISNDILEEAILLTVDLRRQAEEVKVLRGQRRRRGRRRRRCLAYPVRKQAWTILIVPTQASLDDPGHANERATSRANAKKVG